MSATVSVAALARLIEPAVVLSRAYAARRDALQISLKSPGQLVTEADNEVEALIRRTLRAEFGDAAVVGEEGGGTLDAQASGWVVDPIDGTSNFLRGLPMWGISLGLLQRGVSIAGGVALPELEIVLAAAENKGVELNGCPFKRVADRARGKMIALGENDFEAGGETDRRAEALRQQGFTVVRYQCAVFALASAALGRLDGYIERGCFLWDIAAASIICREAGMNVEISPLDGGRYAVDARWPG